MWKREARGVGGLLAVYVDEEANQIFMCVKE